MILYYRQAERPIEQLSDRELEAALARALWLRKEEVQQHSNAVARGIGQAFG